MSDPVSNGARCSAVKESFLMAECEAAFEACDELGDAAGPGQGKRKCQDLLEVCLDPGESAYHLPLGRQQVKVLGQGNCFKVARQIAGTSEIAKWKSDGKTKFERSLHLAGVREFAAKGDTIGRKLAIKYNGATKYIEVQLTYSVEALGNNRFRLLYSIADPQDRPLCKNGVLEFSKQDGRIAEELAFAITLSKEGDASRPASVRIVEM